MCDYQVTEVKLGHHKLSVPFGNFNMCKKFDLKCLKPSQHRDRNTIFKV